MKTKINSENGIIFLTLNKHNDEAEAEAIVSQLEEVFGESGKEFPIVVYLDSYKYSTAKARFRAAEFLSCRASQIPKIAFVGNQNELFELAAKIVLALSGYKDYKFLKTKEEAIDWIFSSEQQKNLYS